MVNGGVIAIFRERAFPRGFGEALHSTSSEAIRALTCASAMARSSFVGPATAASWLACASATSARACRPTASSVCDRRRGRREHPRRPAGARDRGRSTRAKICCMASGWGRRSTSDGRARANQRRHSSPSWCRSGRSRPGRRSGRCAITTVARCACASTRRAIRPGSSPASAASALAVLTVWLLDRGRDASYLAPPAQSRTGPIRAYGSHLGCLTAKRASGQG